MYSDEYLLISLDETIQAGNLIYLQSILLARYIRGESVSYTGFQWKRTT